MLYLRNGVIGALSVLLVIALSTGCQRKRPGPIEPGLDSGATRPSGVEETTGQGLPPVDIESLVFDPVTGVRPIYFDYDSYTLRPDALSTLRHNAEVLKQYPGVIIQIEGHCDERGTQEYNLALGEKRALATRDHLMKLGISGDRMITISYGEEDPVDPGHNESAWAKNRRCEFKKARQ